MKTHAPLEPERRKVSQFERAQRAGIHLWSSRFSFALIACALAILLEFFLNRVTGDPISFFLPAFGAIIVSAGWAGAGPGLVATLVLVNWSAYSLWREGASVTSTSLRCLIFAVEGVLLSVGGSRVWRSMHDATQTETWHRKLIETATEGIWVQNDQGVITWANARMAEILSVTSENLIGRNVEEFIFPADLSMERIRATNLRHRLKEQFDRRLRRSDGTEVWVLACCSLMSINNEVSGSASLAMMTEITERKRAELALRLSEERFRNLFENALEGIYQSTADGRLLSANPMLLEILGFTNEAELRAVNIKDLYLDPSVRENLLHQLTRDGIMRNIEFDLRRRDGKVITVLANGRLVRDDSGHVLYHEGALIDITPRKRMEENLRDTQKMEALGNLASAVAGDFSDALASITTSAKAALDVLPAVVPQNHPSRSDLQQVLRSAANAASVTRQLRSFSRSLAPEERSVDLNVAVRRSSAALRSNPVLSLGSSPVIVFIGEQRIELICRRLSESIQRSFPSDALEWKVRVASVGDVHGAGLRPGTYAVLSIARRDAPNDFREQFAGRSLRILGPPESTTMGLVDTYTAISNSDGFLINEQSGSAFHVLLPCGDAGALVEMDNPQTPAEAQPVSETVLLVEEEPLIRELSRDMLERHGYRVIVASDARDAERIASASGSFNLLITDIVMPEITGPELARRLRVRSPDLKVLFIAGYHGPGKSARAVGDENTATIERPFSADSLVRKIRAMMGSEEMSSEKGPHTRLNL